MSKCFCKKDIEDGIAKVIGITSKASGIEGIPANLKYYQCALIPKASVPLKTLKALSDFIDCFIMIKENTFERSEQTEPFKEYSSTRLNKQVFVYTKSYVDTFTNLSHIYFHNIFTSACGISPHDYLINCRISEAKKLLWQSDMRIDIIAEKCGFGCQQYFTKIFKSQTGTTPAKYRKEIQMGYFAE